jgi:nucleotide-binding universal stress UspA family protein
MIARMVAVMWIVEMNWEACIDFARAVVPADFVARLVYVSPSDVERLVDEGPGRLLGRRPAAAPPESVARSIAAEEAQALLEAARTRLGRPAELRAVRGHPERELLEACADADLLVLARDGEPRLGPKSFSRQARFVLDHTPCAALVVCAGTPPPADTAKLPPHLSRSR